MKNSGRAATEIVEQEICRYRLLMQGIGQEPKESACSSDSENGFFPNQVGIPRIPHSIPRSGGMRSWPTASKLLKARLLESPLSDQCDYVVMVEMLLNFG